MLTHSDLQKKPSFSFIHSSSKHSVTPVLQRETCELRSAPTNF